MSASESAAPSRNVLGGLLGMLGMSGIAGVLIAALITPVIAVAGVAANSTITLFESLPDYLEIGSNQQKTELWAHQGGSEVKFAEFYAQNREEVNLDQISPYVQDAAISTEDPRFYQHGGVDVLSAGRALALSLISDADAGASTITMQYVRNVRVQAAESLPDPTLREQAYKDATEQSMGRKLQEMRLAIGVEHQYSKEEILQGYLNIALFGGTVYGIESAAQYYFSKSAKDLTLAEAASLVATVQNPNVYRVDVPDNLENNKERRNYVLDNMVREGKLDAATRDATAALPVEPHVTPTKHGCVNAEGNAQYFCDYIRNVVLQDAVFGETPDERMFNFQTKGYQIHTSLDLDLQAVAQQAIADSVPPAVEAGNIGTATSEVEVGTGRILAMAQNTVFDDTEAAASTPGASAVNFNTDYNYGGSTGFQVGSTYKIFTLTEWLASGHSLNESVNAQTRAFNLANFRTSCGDANGGTWSPRNDGGAKLGSVTALQATINSYNTAFVAMGEKLDQCRIRDTAMALGAHRADGQPNSDYPSDILGTNEIAPLSMAVAVASLANGGLACTPIAIDSISLHDGTAVEPPKSTCTQAVAPEVAAGVTYAMQQTAAGGTASPSNPGTVPMIGKTGTTDDAIHTWVVGATSKVAAVTWVGNISGSTSLYNFQLAHTVASQERHVIMKKVMSQIMGTYGGGEFPAPPANATKPQQATVPDLSGRSIDEATKVLTELGFTVSVGPAVASQQPAGTVGQQLPSANTQVDTGTTVTINPSTGSAEGGSTSLTMPDLTGMSPQDAIKALSAAHFTGTMYQFTEPASGGVKPGQIIRTDPAAGAPAPANADVKIYVAS